MLGGRRIRVLLSSGKPMNSSRSIPNRDLPLETLIAGEHQLEREESERNGGLSKDSAEQNPDSEPNGESDQSESLRRRSSSSSHDSGSVPLGPHQLQVKKEEDEIPSTAAGERPGRDIRFGNLPQPRKAERFEPTNTDSTPSPRKSNVVLRNESAVDDTEEEPARRTITIDDDATPHRRDSAQLRLRRAASAGFTRAATFERILSNTFRRRRREGSPSSRRSSMTLPYFTFQPTIVRNSLFVGLTEEQREELGGVEYRAVKLLLKVLVGGFCRIYGTLIVVYFFGLLFFSWMGLGAWILRDQTFGPVVDNAGVSRSWWAIFTGSSMFNDLGNKYHNISI